MSTTIDQRVVEMRFDNQHFEKNVQTSMSTLDKLKQSLNLTGASKGLENINAAARNNDIGALGTSVEQVQAKFSALQVMGVTALANLTNSAVNAGKKMVSALTIDPIKTGFQEYETQINAVQTILANTSSKGTTIDQVNEALEELNKYADMTIYNFTEMTRNIGTFTAAGVGLDTSVSAIKGIANLAAVSGSTSQQASTAMYQLSQALATGTVKLQDWNSVVNAGMGGEVFQNALVRTAATMAGASENVEEWRAANIDAHGSFRDSLTQGAWLTTDVLTETLNQFTMAAEEGTDEWKKYKKALSEQGYTEKQAEEILKMANTATDAATKVKTFTQLWDVLKESAQSGWSQTWKLIVGDFEEAKGLLTPLADFLTGAINKISDARNNLIEGALGKSFAGIVDKVKGVTKPLTESANSIKSVVKSVEDYKKVVDDIIGGEWGNGQERWEALTKAGYDWAQAQNMVNEKLGDSTRHATDYVETQKESNKEQEKAVKTTKASAAATAAMIHNYCAMTDEQLRSKGYSEEQIKAFRELADAANKTGIPLKEFIENIDEIDGRYLLINSFKNAGQGLVSVITAIKDAWVEAFPPMTSDQLFNIIAGLHKFSTHLTMSEETVDKLKRTFKGLFSILGIVSDVLGGGIKIAFKAVQAVLGHFNLGILDVTAGIGDALVAFRKATNLTNLFGKTIDYLIPIITEAAKSVGEWVKEFLDLPMVQKAISKVTDVLNDLKSIDLREVGENIIAGLVEGLGGGAEKAIQAIINLGIKILEGIKGVLGIHSPSTEFFEIGKNIIDGLINGLQNGFEEVGKFFKTLGSKCVELISNIDWGTVYAAAVSVGVVAMLKKIMDILDAFSAPFGGIGAVFEESADVIHKSTKNIKKILGGFAKVLKAHAFEKTAKGLKQLAIAIAILAASVYVLSTVNDPKKLWNAVGVIAALAGIMGGLAWSLNKIGDSAVSIGKDGLKIGGMKAALISIGLSLLLLAATVKVLGAIDPESAKQGFIRLAGCLAALVIVFASYGKLVKGKNAQNIDKLGKMMMKMSISLLLLAGVVKLIGMLSPEEMKQGAAFAAGFVVFVAALSLVTRLAGKKIDSLGGMILKLSFAMMLLIGVAKLAGTLSEAEIKKGLGFAVAFTLFVGALTAITRGKKDTEIQKVGGILLAISGAMLIMTGVVKIIGGLSTKEMIKGGIAILAFVGVIKTLVNTVKSIKKDVPKVAGTLIAISVAIGILAAVAFIMSLMSLKGLVKGVAAVGVLSLFMSGLIKATNGANEVKGSIMAMAIAIGVMAGSVALLSLIPFEKLAPAVAGLGVLMGMFALIAKSASNMKKAMGPLIVMTVAIGIIAASIWTISKIPTETALGSAAALSMLMLSMAATMAIIGATKSVTVKALAAIGVLTLIVGILAQILVKMGDMDAESVVGKVKALSVLLLTLSGVCVILGVVGLMQGAAFTGIAALAALIVGIGAVIVGIGALVDKFPKMETFLNKGLPILEKIGYGIGSFFGGIVAGFSASVISIIPMLGNALGAFSVGVAPFIAVAKTVDMSVVKGIGILALAIAELTAANIVAGVGNFLSFGSDFASLGYQLSAFIVNAMPFITTIKSIDPAAVESANTLANMIMTLTKADLINSIASFFGMGVDFSNFGAQLSAFGDAIVEFSKKVSGNIDPAAVEQAATAGKIMSELQNSLPKTGGWIQEIVGEKDLANFGASCEAFGASIAAFSRSVSGDNAIDLAAAEAAANAGKVMSELQNSLPKTGGWVQEVAGSQDLVAFGESCEAFGKAIVTFCQSVNDNGAIDIAAAQKAADAGAIMVELQKALPKTGGWWQSIAGVEDLETFGASCVAFGTAISDFCKNVTVDEDAVEKAAKAGTLMAELQAAIPEDKWFDGKVSIDQFGAEICSFGGYIKSYSEKVSGIEEASITTSTNAAKELVKVAKSLKGVDPDAVDNFKAKKLGNALKDYSDKVSTVDNETITNSISAISRLKNLINGMAGIDTSGVDSFKSAITTLSKTNVKGVASSLSSASSELVGTGSNMIESVAKGMKNRQSMINSTGSTIVSNLQKQISSSTASFQAAGVDAMTKFAAGLKSGAAKVKEAIKTPLSSGISGAREYYDDFYSVGSYLVTGFANGISENSYKAAAKAKAMANAAEKAAKEALDINSPSRVFAALGSGVVEGFVKGIRDNEKNSEFASERMANTAVKGFSKAINTVNELMSGDMDVQPTIRPVLDLSNVTSGAKSINGLFDMTPNIGVMSNIGAVSSLINGRSQNGSNADVISAINKLRSDLGNLGNTTYNVNGITYDDGTNVSNAVKDIIRYTRIEGRV